MGGLIILSNISQDQFEISNLKSQPGTQPGIRHARSSMRICFPFFPIATRSDSEVSSHMSKTMKVGVLTGGGDAPGLNPAIKGLVYRGSQLNLKVIGLFDGWRSLLNPLPDVQPLHRQTVRRWDRDGGTNLGSSRTNPFKQ